MQAQLRVSSPGDPAEQEAHAVGKQVARMAAPPDPAGAAQVGQAGSGVAQRQVAPGIATSADPGTVHRLETGVGVGAIIDPTGSRRREPNVCSVWGTTLGYQIVSVTTYSDAWLPHTLQGQPQPEVWAQNANRLERALREMHAVFGVPPSYEPQTPFAIVHDYTVSNHTYDDGEVIEVV
jgi:hypothetical protein